MPKSLWDAAARQEVLGRLKLLEPNATARWGSMSAPQMLAHCLDWMHMTSGELATEPRNNFLRFTLVKQLAIYWLPFPKGVPTAPELIARQPVDWGDEHAALCGCVESFDQFRSRSDWPVHPAFGTLTPRAWGVLGYRHLDHHLRQFGV